MSSSPRVSRPLPPWPLRVLVEGVASLLRFRGYWAPRRLRLVPISGPIREYDGWPPLWAERTRYGPAGEVILIMPRMTTTQFHHLRVEARDRLGRPAQVSDPQWLTDNPNVLRLVPWADGRECYVLPVGPLGSATVTYRADGDPEAGVAVLEGSIAYSVVAGVATQVQLHGGVPQEIENLPAGVGVDLSEGIGGGTDPGIGTDPGGGTGGAGAGGETIDPVTGGGLTGGDPGTGVDPATGENTGTTGEGGAGTETPPVAPLRAPRRRG